MRRLVCLLLFLWGCSPDVPADTSPAQTFRVYADAVTGNQPEQVWNCLSTGYRELSYADNLQRWLAAWEHERPQREQAVRRLQIRDEVLINEEIAFLRFDESTIESGESPFFYFLREKEEWKITSHLDPAFRQALEDAVVAGEYRLPLAP